MKYIDFDDRDLAILGLVGVAVAAVLVLEIEAKEVLTACIVAIGSLARGKVKNGNGNQPNNGEEDKK